MFQVNLILVSGAILLTAYTTNVDAEINVPALKAAFKDFFDTADTICGSDQGVAAARTAYNSAADQATTFILPAADQATTYEELVNCGRTAYAIYHPFLLRKSRVNYGKIIDLSSRFAAAIIAATPGAPDSQRLIPFEGFSIVTTTALTAQLLNQGSRQERS